MHFLRTLVFSAVVYASAAFAVTIPVGSCDEVKAKDIKIDIEVNHKQLAEVSEQLVFPMTNSLLDTHIYANVCIYAYSKLHTSLSKNPLGYCPPIKCISNVQCQNYDDSCGWCSREFGVSLAT